MDKLFVLSVLLVVLLIGCAQPSVKETDLLRFKIEELERQLQQDQMLIARLAAEVQATQSMKSSQAVSDSNMSVILKQYDAQLHKLEQQLQQEKARNEKLSNEIQAILPPKAVKSTPISEIIALPELYVDKEIVLTGSLVSQVHFEKDIGHFMIQGTSLNLSVHCYFRRDSLDQLSRRLIVTKEARNQIQVQGRLVKSTFGLSKELGIRYPFGYEFAVEKILE